MRDGPIQTSLPNESADPRDRPARRRCLGCGRDFRSAWAGNRRCERCKSHADRRNVEGLPDIALPSSAGRRLPARGGFT